MSFYSLTRTAPLEDSKQWTKIKNRNYPAHSPPVNRKQKWVFTVNQVQFAPTDLKWQKVWSEACQLARHRRATYREERLMRTSTCHCNERKEKEQRRKRHMQHWSNKQTSVSCNSSWRVLVHQWDVLKSWVQLTFFFPFNDTQSKSDVKMILILKYWVTWIKITGFIWARVASQPFLIVLCGFFCCCSEKKQTTDNLI